MRQLRARNLTHLMHSVTVPTRSWRSLVHEQGVRSVGLFKLDVEGQEAGILQDMAHLCEEERELCPRAIIFESTHLTPVALVSLHELLLRIGYMWASPLARRDQIYALGLTMCVADTHCTPSSSEQTPPSSTPFLKRLEQPCTVGVCVARQPKGA